jgi:hypothetical protein
VDNRGENEIDGSPGNHWDRLDDFLHTDPRDAGCETTMEMLDIYADLVAAGADPADRFPSIQAHLMACGPCAEDLEGLLAAITDKGSPGVEPSQ